MPLRIHSSTRQLVHPGLWSPIWTQAEEVTQLLIHVLLAIQTPRATAAAFPPSGSLTHRFLARQVGANIVELSNRMAADEFVEKLADLNINLQVFHGDGLRAAGCPTSVDLWCPHGETICTCYPLVHTGVDVTFRCLACRRRIRDAAPRATPGELDIDFRPVGWLSMFDYAAEDPAQESFTTSVWSSHPVELKTEVFLSVEAARAWWTTEKPFLGLRGDEGHDDA